MSCLLFVRLRPQQRLPRNNLLISHPVKHKPLLLFLLLLPLVSLADFVSVPSTSLGQPIAVKTWGAERAQASTPVFLFLHGRGYAHGPESSQSVMLEAMGLESWLQSSIGKACAPVILSPQDQFLHGSRVGRDYWLGNDQRQWLPFLHQELRSYLENRWPALSDKPWGLFGISMGAHGALSLGLLDPAKTSAVVAISPVFRTESTLNPAAYPGFYSKGQYQPQRSLGQRLLDHPQSTIEALKAFPHWIRIHQRDFSLNIERFPNSTTIWKNLRDQSHPPLHQILVERDPESSSGHDTTYWRHVLAESLNFLCQQSRRRP